ncbi:hypothetical protein B484DRAFT_393865, partial [Ochromonadaceae sp. CCMP2298]
HPEEGNLEEQMDSLIPRSMRPPCAFEATLAKKRRRLANWIRKPEVVQSEIDFWRENARKCRENSAAQEAEQEEWLGAFQVGRRVLSSLQRTCIEHNRRLKTEGGMLSALCEAECGHKRRKRSVGVRDMLDELKARQGAVALAAEEYVLLAQEGKGVVVMEVRELHYAGDEQYILGRPSARTGTGKGTGAGTGVVAGTGAGAVLVEAREEQGPSHSYDSTAGAGCADIPLPYFDAATGQISPADNMPPPEAEGAMEVEVGVMEVEEVEGGLASRTTRSKNAGPAGSEGNSASASASAIANAGAVAGAGAGAGEEGASVLAALFAQVQEGVRQGELSVADAEFMLSVGGAEDVAFIRSLMESRHSPPDLPWMSHRLKTDERIQVGGPGGLGGALDPADPYLSLSRGGQGEWGAYMGWLFAGQQGATTRKKKKEVLSVTVDLRLRTQYGVSLLLSPLSQYEDRLLGHQGQGSIYTPHAHPHAASEAQTQTQVCYGSTVQLPTPLRQAEDEALERCALHSCAAVADLQLRKLKSHRKEMTRLLAEATNSLARAEYLRGVAAAEDATEQRRMRKELLLYGVAKPEPDEGPVSPLSVMPLHSFGQGKKKVLGRAPKVNGTVGAGGGTGGAGVGAVGAGNGVGVGAGAAVPLAQSEQQSGGESGEERTSNEGSSDPPQPPQPPQPHPARERAEVGEVLQVHVGLSKEEAELKNKSLGLSATGKRRR